MPLKNREGLKEFNISPDWYKHRKPGISAMIRCANEAKWVVPCLDSILPFFDEIVITVGPSTDRTREVIDEYVRTLPNDSCFQHYRGRNKVRVFDYPFSLREPDPEPDSVNDKSYYCNWTLSKTTYGVVAKWDFDMQMIPIPDFYNIAMRKNIVRIRGYNVVKTNPYYLSKINPIEHYEPRFIRITKDMHYVQAPRFMPKPVHGRELLTYDAAGLIPHFREWYAIRMPPRLYLYRIYNALTKKDLYFKMPIFIHTKFLKLKEDPDASWCPNWKEEIMPGERLILENCSKISGQ
jgi:glycosyltransferase involved in cell wall biosynthesis